MPRNLHITIFEGGGAGTSPGSRRGGGRGYGGYDPEPDETLLPPDNPEPDETILTPDNPEPDETVLPPDNPDGGAWQNGAWLGTGGRPAYAQSAAAGPALAWISESDGSACGCAAKCCCCGDGKGAGAATAQPGVRESEYSGFVIIRLTPGVEELSEQGIDAESLWQLAELLGLTALRDLLDLPRTGDDPSQPATAGGARPAGTVPSLEPEGSLVGRPLIDMPARRGCEESARSRSEVVLALREMEKQAAGTAFRPLHSLVSYWRLDLRPHPELVEEVVARLNAMAVVDVAYRELSALEPQTMASTGGSALAEDQGYLADAPVGVGAAWAWKLLMGSQSQSQTLAMSTGLKVCDLEQGWHLQHEELGGVDPLLYYGANRTEQGVGQGHHGTAVLGQMAAAGVGVLGVLGGATSVGDFVLASHYRSRDDKDKDGTTPHPFAGSNGHVAAAIVNALVARPANPQPLKVGDVLLLEVQRGRWPTEVDDADLDAVRLASALGVVVVEAAGNGGFDLDAWSSPHDGRRLRRGASGFRDSGAVVVGASYSALPHDRAPFSNYGSRLDCFAWGDSVTTCGYGNLAGDDVPRYYTNTFAGTSSASPVIAAAAALVQRLHEEKTSKRLYPGELRAVLSDPATGTRQGPHVAGFIGIMPDLGQVCRRGLDLVPEVYVRRSVCDDGSAAAAAGEPMGSSPDVVVAVKAPDGEGSTANAPASGRSLAPGESGELWVRLRNRGSGVGEVDVRLFASPAATLVTPERWQLVGDLPTTQVLQGDLLTVTASRQWTAPQWTPPSSPPKPAWTSPPPYSFLAVLRHPEPPLTSSTPPPFPPLFERGDGLPPGPPYFDWAEYRAFLRRPGVAWRNVHRVAAPPANQDLELPFFVAGTPDVARRFDFEVVQRLPDGVELFLAVPKALEVKLHQRRPWTGAPGPDGLALPARHSTRFAGVGLAAGLCAPAVFRLRGTGLGKGHSLALRQLWQGQEVGRVTWYFRPEGAGGE